MVRDTRRIAIQRMWILLTSLFFVVSLVIPLAVSVIASDYSYDMSISLTRSDLCQSKLPYFNVLDSGTNNISSSLRDVYIIPESEMLLMKKAFEKDFMSLSREYVKYMNSYSIKYLNISRIDR